MKNLLIAIFALFLFIPAVTYAENTDAFRDVLELNRVDPLQNPQFETGQDLIANNVTDSQIRVLAKTTDIIIDMQGDIQALYADFKDKDFGDHVYLSFNELNMRILSNAFNLDTQAGQLATLLPQILATTATASGEVTETMSVSKVKGAKIVGEDGRHFGTIKNILFKDGHPTAEAVVIEISRRQMIALPFGVVTLVPPKNPRARLTFTVAEDYRAAAKDYLKSSSR